MNDPAIFLKYAAACDQQGHPKLAAKAREVHALAVEAKTAVEAGKTFAGLALMIELAEKVKELGGRF